ncbi:MAG: nucleotidyltransferase family protein [Candidatus Caldatribacteriota bacterium]|nr:nucleotidyltransferase family protein [Candidatus Caldatribacteriota bacterium]
MNIVEIKKILEKYNNDLKKTFHVNEIGIFGSFVKGQEKADNSSDIDILINFKKGHKDFFNYMRLKYYLENLLGREVDLVIKEAVKPRLKERIFSEVEYV